MDGSRLGTPWLLATLSLQRELITRSPQQSALLSLCKLSREVCSDRSKPIVARYKTTSMRISPRGAITMRWNVVGRMRFSGSGGKGECDFAIRFRWPHSGQRPISPGNLFGRYQRYSR